MKTIHWYELKLVTLFAAWNNLARKINLQVREASEVKHIKKKFNYFLHLSNKTRNKTYRVNHAIYLNIM